MKIKKTIIILFLCLFFIYNNKKFLALINYVIKNKQKTITNKNTTKPDGPIINPIIVNFNNDEKLQKKLMCEVNNIKNIKNSFFNEKWKYKPFKKKYEYFLSMKKYYTGNICIVIPSYIKSIYQLDIFILYLYENKLIITKIKESGRMRDLRATIEINNKEKTFVNRNKALKEHFKNYLQQNNLKGSIIENY